MCFISVGCCGGCCCFLFLVLLFVFIWVFCCFIYGGSSACVIFKLRYLTLTSNTPKTDAIYLCVLFLSVGVVVVVFLVCCFVVCFYLGVII